MLFGSTPHQQPRYGDTINEVIEEFEHPCQTKIACPYVTSKGVNEFCTTNSGQDWTQQCSTEWIVGLNQGVTQPSALREIRQKNDATLKIFAPRRDITEDSLHSTPFLHAKTAFIRSESSPDERALLVTSANITDSAIGNPPTNYELGYLNGNEKLRDSSVQKFNSWWQSLDTQSIIATETLIQEYSDLYEDTSFNQSADTSSAEIKIVEEAYEAKYFWIFSGTLSSGSRHQLDLKRELASFFGELSEEFYIDIIIDGERYNDNKVLLREKQHMVNQWRVHLPTRSDGFEGHADDNEVYCDKYLLFEQVPEDGVFILQIREENAPEIENWKHNSTQFGTSEETESVGTGNPKEYGFY